MTTRRFSFIAPSIADTLDRYELLLRAIKARGHRILLIAPEAGVQKQAVKDVARLHNIGAEYRPLGHDVRDRSVREGWRVRSNLRAIFRDCPSSGVVAIGETAIVHGVPVARRARAETIVSVCDDLPDFLKPTVKAGERLKRFVLRRALSRSTGIILHNRDHQKLMRHAQLIDRWAPITIVPGCGIDVDTHDHVPVPDLANGLTFLMAAELDAGRGVVNYIQAARQVASKVKDARFLFLGQSGSGDLDVEAAGFKGSQFTILDGDLDCTGALAKAHVFVYPSHSEGMPYTVLRALAAGRPVITTNTPGCRDTVDETVNGYLVPRGDIGALVAAMSAVVKQPDLIPAMARASRLKAERRFDVRDVNRTILSLIGA